VNFKFNVTLALYNLAVNLRDEHATTSGDEHARLIIELYAEQLAAFAIACATAWFAFT
jgi:hypothetical protein